MAELGKDQLGCSSEHEEQVVRRLREESNSWEELQPPGNVAADGQTANRELGMASWLDFVRCCTESVPEDLHDAHGCRSRFMRSHASLDYMA